jgi:hypothetical protein
VGIRLCTRRVCPVWFCVFARCRRDGGSTRANCVVV